LLARSASPHGRKIAASHIRWYAGQAETAVHWKSGLKYHFKNLKAAVALFYCAASNDKMNDNIGARTLSRSTPNNMGDDHVRSDQEETEIAIERRIIRKQDTHLMPLLFAIYLLSFLDRSNIGSAGT
jgi:hypothetical protein